MTTSSLIPFPDQFEVDNNGNLLVGGFLFTYFPDTSDPKATYSDAGLTALNAQPIVFNGIGRANVYGSGSYDFVLQDPLGNQIYRQRTSSYLQSDVISDYMLTVVSQPDPTTAQAALGLPQLEAQWAASISRITGPTGPIGNTGFTGPTGPQGAASVGTSANIQDFSVSGTWTKPTTNIGLVIVQILGSGGAGSDGLGGGGGGQGGYFFGIFPVGQISDSITITCGQGGIFVSGATLGANGGNTTFGSLTMSGGTGGTITYDSESNPTPINGVPGRITSAGGLYPVAASYSSEPSISSSPGGNLVQPAVTAIFGGSGGGYIGGQGVFPGGGGGVNGGSGASGRIIVTAF